MRMLFGGILFWALLFGFAWLIGASIEPAAFVILGVPWFGLSIYSLWFQSHDPPSWCMPNSKWAMCQPEPDYETNVIAFLRHCGATVVSWLRHLRT